MERVLKNSVCEIFNTDQGSQFTAKNFIDLLLKTGKEFNFNTYFTPEARKNYPRDKILKLAAKYALPDKNPDHECYREYGKDSSIEDYQLRFDSKGLLFSLVEPHVAQACANEYLIPYQDIQSLLK